MKKQLFLLISGFLFIMMVVSAPLVSAEEASLTVSAQVNSSTKVVTISGTISSGAGQVSIVVKNPSGGVDYLDQASSGSGGTYVFRYTLDESKGGTYGVTVGGSGITRPVTTAFTYTVQGKGGEVPAPTAPTNGSGANSSGTAGPNPKSTIDQNPKSYKIDADKLTSASSNKRAIVTVPDGTEEVLLPSHSAQLLGSKSLMLQMGKMSVTLQPQVLSDLENLAGSKDLENAVISINLKQGSQEEVNKLLPSGQNGTKIRSVGHVGYFELSIKTKDGRINRLNSFSTPLEVALSYNQTADTSLLGVYYRNPRTGQWDYVGGQIDEKNHVIVAKISSPGEYAVMEYQKKFSDIPMGYWANQAIQLLSAKHIINGITDTEFAPQQKVTRAEFTALIVRVLDLKESKHSHPFKDVASNVWYAGDVASAYEAGIISGLKEGNFAPNGNLSREEMAAMLIRALEYTKGKPTATTFEAKYGDQDQISKWAKPYVNRATEAGLMKGTNHRFNPKSLTTRVEAVQVIYNLMMQNSVR